MREFVCYIVDEGADHRDRLTYAGTLNGQSPKN